MNAIAWTPKLETGVPFVDLDHRVLLRLLNQVIEADEAREDSSVLGSVLNSLVAYTDYHFAREEMLQALCECDCVEEHSKVHRALAGRVTEIRDRFLADPGNMILAEVRAFLTSWMVDHILKVDQQSMKACRKNPAAIEECAAIGFADAGGGGISWAALKVLVVEDNPHFSSLLTTLLKAAGVKDIRTTKNALEGLDRIAQRPVDIVLCDVLMDEMKGDEMARKAFRIDPRTRFVFVSALEAEALADRARQAGVDGYLEKPITPAGLFAAISNVVTSAVRATA